MDSAILLNIYSYLLDSDLLGAERYLPFEKHAYHHQGSYKFRKTNFKEFRGFFKEKLQFSKTTLL